MRFSDSQTKWPSESLADADAVLKGTGQVGVGG